MSYAPRMAGMGGHDMFDNVFINPSPQLAGFARAGFFLLKY